MVRTVPSRSIATMLVLVVIGAALVACTKIPVIGPVFPAFCWGQLGVIAWIGVATAMSTPDDRFPFRWPLKASLPFGEVCLMLLLAAAYDNARGFCAFLGSAREQILEGMATFSLQDDRSIFGWGLTTLLAIAVVTYHAKTYKEEPSLSVE